MFRLVRHLILAIALLGSLFGPNCAVSAQEEQIGGPIGFGLSDWETVILGEDYQIRLSVDSVYDRNVGTSVKFRHVGAVDIVLAHEPTNGYLERCEPLEDFYCVNWVVGELHPGEVAEFVITAKALSLDSLRSRSTFLVDYRKEGTAPVSKESAWRTTQVCSPLIPIGQHCP